MAMGVYKKKYKKKMKDGTIIPKESKKYWIRYRYEGKLKREPASPDYKQSLALLRKRQTEIIEGKYFNIKKSKRRVLVNEMANNFLEWSKNNKRAYVTDKGIVKNIKVKFGKKYIDEITPVMLENYKNELAKDKSKSTANRYLSCIRCMYNMAIKEKLFEENIKVEFNPVERVNFFTEPEPRNRVLSLDEINSLFRTLKYPKFRHIKYIVFTAFYTGMRRGEILNLKWKNVNLTGLGEILVTKTKSNKDRKIPLHSNLKEMLSSLQIKHKSKAVANPEDYVFLNPNTGKPFRDIRKPFNLLLKKANISNFVFHSLRHNFGSQLGASHVDITTIMVLMGHSNVTTTQRYVHSYENVKRQAVEKLPSDTKSDTTGISELGRKPFTDNNAGVVQWQNISFPS